MFSRIIHSADKIIRQISHIMGMVAVVVLVAMMMITVADVVLRYFFNRPISGSSELSEIMMVFAGFLGFAWCAIKGMHIKVDLIVGRLSEKAQAVLNTFSHILVIGVCILIGWRAYSESMAARVLNDVFEVTGIPYYPIFWVISVGYGLMIFAMIILLVQSISQVLKR